MPRKAQPAKSKKPIKENEEMRRKFNAALRRGIQRASELPIPPEKSLTLSDLELAPRGELTEPHDFDPR